MAAMTSVSLVRTAGIRSIEARFADAEPTLMERAGAAIAGAACAMLGNSHGPVLIVAGPGNNGGDGLVANRLLKEQGIETVVLRAGIDDIPARDWRLVIDAVFGIGLARPVEGRLAEVIDAMNALDCPILAVDIPSGLCADTGRVLGRAVGASRTLTFIAGKPGLYTLDGPDRCGEVVVDSLGLEVADSDGRLVSTDLFRNQLQPRRRNTHKGDYGNVGIIGGAPGMTGAALLAGRAALRLGAGRVYVGMLERVAVDPAQPELMLRPAEDMFDMATIIAAGPGLGQSTEAEKLLRRAIESPLPLVLDADALNLLAAHPVLATKISRRGTPAMPNTVTILTPHPAEAGRLLGTDTAAIQSDRLSAALALARRFNAHVVLKGRGSIVATPDGAWFINASGNAGLASAGSGDVLTGIVAALLAQHWPPLKATLAAVHLHGCAADDLVAAGTGPIGIAAGELIDAARTRLNHWIINA
jgi:hydroxyethylthiazole kinase-like uncharacterized protein yjeF